MDEENNRTTEEGWHTSTNLVATAQCSDQGESYSPLDVPPSCSCCNNWNWLHISYLSIFSTFGVTIRAFMGRFFGGDCDAVAPIDDWLYPLSHKICITASGLTEQYGGALFTDLPANMFGSFIMGLMTGHSSEWPAIPWLRHDHPLQIEDGLHVGLKTALCGTITTFSSWNSQMVLMMDGSANVYIGSQVGAAIFGYIIGLQASVVSYRTGRTFASWFHLKNNPHIFESAEGRGHDSDVSTEAKSTMKGRHFFNARVLPSFLVAVTFTLYVLGDFYWHIQYYRQLWLACLVAPFGTLLRWKLSTLNGKLKCNNMQWFPTGTFSANFIASIISAAINATLIRSPYVDSLWALNTVKSFSLGFAGSLSTVSTFVKEIVEMGDKNPQFDKKAFLYSHGTMLSCCCIGLAFYCPIARAE
jgi:fluoride ion exporter CrcB/FEX